VPDFQRVIRDRSSSKILRHLAKGFRGPREKEEGWVSQRACCADQAQETPEVIPLNVESVLTVFGGLGLFLYGMFKMGDGLQESAGDRMRRILEALTSNRFMAVAVGMVVTMVIQASGATTVMAVGFANAGLVTLEQAIGITMGADIGTTITAQMVAFRLERAALPAIGLGMLMRLTARKRRTKSFADVIIGFGILFLGIDIMGNALGDLKSYPPFVRLMGSSEKDPLLGVLVGVAFTAAIQSSSATTSLLVTMASKGLVTLGAAVPIIFGANIGRTVTALIASVGTNLAARRAAVAHLLLNVIGTVLFLPLLRVFQVVAAGTSADVPRQIANAHTFFNVAMVIILFPFMKYFVVVVKKVVKGEEAVERGPKYLDPRFLKTPFSAVLQVKKEVVRMARLCQENFASAAAIFLGEGKQDRRRLDDVEAVVDELEEAISSYVAKISQQGVTDEQAKMLTSMINVATDLERVGDHSTAVIEMADYRAEHNLPFSDEAMRELKEMILRVQEVLGTTVEALEKEDKEQAAKVAGMDDAVDRMEKDLRAGHIRRLNQGICFPASGVVYLELLTHLERVGDHAVNVAEAVMS
jgi:phosphate:Na+ symporter